jgi:hypothetical protein
MAKDTGTKEPLIILLILLVLAGLAYGPTKNSNPSGSNKSSNRNTISSIGTTDNLGNSSNKSAAEEIKKAAAEVKKLEENLKKAEDRSKRSPYYSKITMSSSISGLQGSDPNREYISMSTSLSGTETVRITGWYLKSEITGYYAVIGKAALLPFSFTKTESDVILQKGDKVYLTKGFSPIGISFRTNKCTGFFEENRTFIPSLSLRCPFPKDEKLPKFSDVYDRNDECVALIERIPRCRTRDSEFIRDLPDTVSDSCKTYITTQINYNFCVARHFSDIDFPGNEYRLYLNKFGPLWRTKHDTINLHDENGLVVDTIKY